ncbi:putative two-component histidine kinase [Vibrio halioticoli NBRC 102217]|uniref:Putative two-component histidine kinase n=1 Tax=Vibrio halioticoli NBRC 102217 TaxID=1219072 RepID=V5FCK8_9VIBR|nr:LytS/YhcK type 5TM receptor domain-containing protein [Vibrio halioticoli]GAD89208.1 putative two-component histidine kinase [Vibrio halioticoli NBRC 102217]
MYIEQLMMLLAVVERASLLLMALYFLTHTQIFQAIITKQSRSSMELTILTLFFTLFAIFSTYTGVNVEGSLVNVRIISIVSGGILFGPWVGIPVGLISGVHRYLIDLNGPSSIPCLITSVTAGLLASWVHIRANYAHYAKYGVLVAAICEVMTMGLILILNDDKVLAYSIVHAIALPMIIGALCVSLIIKWLQDTESEKDKVAAYQAKQALKVANQTLPFIRQNTVDALKKVCDIIRAETYADAVAITDTKDVQVYVGYGEEQFYNHHTQVSLMTLKAIQNNTIIESNDIREHAFRSLMIIPLSENGQVTGTLKIFFSKPHQITLSLHEMAIGLSQLISTQLEVAKVEQLKVMANEAEFGALQNKINPHFLFNTLNAISTLIRIEPDRARDLVGKLAGFMRFNLENVAEMIPLEAELQQVDDYVSIEKARFGTKLTVLFDIDDVTASVPPLIIQPLVENAIGHGIVPKGSGGTVSISVKQHDDRVKITVCDDGVGIPQTVIDGVQAGTLDSKRIGLNNVHQRIKLLYGQGLDIQRLNSLFQDQELQNPETPVSGTQISFTIPLGATL